MDKFSWEDFENGKIGVNCDTEEKAKIFLKECILRGFEWTQDKYCCSLYTYWNKYKADTTYYCLTESGHIVYCDKQFYESKGTTVLEFEDVFIKDNKPGEATHISIDEMANIICENMKAIGNASIEYLNNDNAIKPSHYKAGEFDVIAFCQYHDLSFDIGNVIKYVTRTGKKANNSELQDLTKAMEYLKRRIEYIKKVEKDV